MKKKTKVEVVVLGVIENLKKTFDIVLNAGKWNLFDKAERSSTKRIKVKSCEMRNILTRD